MAIGIFGGTFNPIHVGHLIMAQEIASAKKLEKIIFVPARIPPLKKNVLPAKHRFQMTQLAIDDNPLFDISDIEIKEDGPSYTYNTLAKLKENTDQQLFFIVGADQIKLLTEWYRWKDLLEEFSVIFINREKYELDDIEIFRGYISDKAFLRISQNTVQTPKIYISSTLIRKKCKDNISIKYLVTDEVENYIITHGLYKDD